MTPTKHWSFYLNFIHFIQVIVIIFIYLLFSFLTLFHIIIYNLYFDWSKVCRETISKGFGYTVIYIDIDIPEGSFI